MTSEFLFYHGIVFASLVHNGCKEISVAQYPSSDNASYVLNSRVGVYIKYSTKRLSPWQFTFEKRHKAAIVEMMDRYKKVVVILVCHDDGIAGLLVEELDQLLDLKSEFTESLSLIRRQREKYTVNGSQGKLMYKVGMLDYIEKALT